MSYYETPNLDEYEKHKLSVIYNDHEKKITGSNSNSYNHHGYSYIQSKDLFIGINGEQESKRIETPKKIVVPLKIHQQTSLYTMTMFEKNKGYIFEYPKEEETIKIKLNTDFQEKKDKINEFLKNREKKSFLFKTNIGILGDKPGFGKTLTMLSLLAHNKEFKEPKKSTIKTIWKTTNNENKQIISSCTDLNYQNDFHDTITKYNTNIIIVPFGIIKQWEKSINLQTNLNYYLINKTIHINNLKENTFVYDYAEDDKEKKYQIFNENESLIKFKAELEKYDIILISNTFYRKFHDLCENFRYTAYIKHYKFRRVIIDEADSIKLTNFYMPFSEFTWLITATFHNLNYTNNPISNLISPFCNYDSYQDNLCKIVVKNDETYIEQSYSLPEYFTNFYFCEAPKQVKYAMYLKEQNLLSKENLEMINSGNFNSVVESLGGDVSSENDLIQLVTKDLKRQISNKSKEKNLIQSLDIPVDQKTNRINNINKTISSLEEKVKSIESRFSNIQIWDEMRNKLSPEIDEEIEDIIQERYDELITTEEATNKIKKIFEDNSVSQPELQEKIISILDSEERVCSICTSFYNNPVVLKCNHIYCASCLFNWISMQSSKGRKPFCPCCKTLIDMKGLNLIANSGKEEKKKSDSPKKSDTEEQKEDIVFQKINSDNQKEYKSCLEKPKTVMSLINSINLNYHLKKQNKKGRFVIYSSQDTFHSQLESLFQENNITHKIAKGLGMNKSIQDFKDGKIDVLYLNSQFNGAGIELTECTDIIIMNRMNKATEKQIIGRGQRMGRKEPLSVHYISYDNESPY